MTLRPKQTPAEGKFVINLCSVDTPITIPQPQSTQLTRFKFFLSHHIEGGRRRYTLHMGYFATTADAQKWLTILRAVYPNAFVSDSGAATEDTFSDTQVMSILDQRGAERATAGSAESTASRGDLSPRQAVSPESGRGVRVINSTVSQAEPGAAPCTGLRSARS